MFDRLTRDQILLASALGLALLLALVLPLLRPLLPVDETRYLSVAYEMHRSGSWVVPTLNGEVYSHKPPLLFWLINMVWAVTGVSEYAARLVGPAFMVAAVALTWRLGRMLFPDRAEAAGTAALILASTGLFALYGSLTMFDSMLACAVLLGVIGLVHMDEEPGWLGVWLLGAALALGTFAKGPVILLHLAPLALARPLWTSRTGGPGHLAWFGRLGLALALGLALVALWLVPALLQGDGGYRNDILWRQSAGRMVQAFDHARPLWFFLAALPLMAFPWLWRLPALRALAPRQLMGGWQTRLLTIWVVATVLVFSLVSGKQLHYLLPTLPAVALLLARAPLPQSWIGPVGLAAAVLLPLLVWLGMIAFGMATVDGMVPPGVTPLDLAATLALVLGTLAALALDAHRNPALGWALAAPAALVCLHLALRPVFLDLYDPNRFAAEITRAPEAGLAWVGGRYQGEFGFVARLQQPVEVLVPEVLGLWAEQHPGGLLISRLAEPLPFELVQETPFAGEVLRLYRMPAAAGG